MANDRAAYALEQIARDLDLAVFELERPVRDGRDPEAERAKLRRTLEQLRDRVEEIGRSLG